jgi:hypothetical protein
VHAYLIAYRPETKPCKLLPFYTPAANVAKLLKKRVQQGLQRVITSMATAPASKMKGRNREPTASDQPGAF